MLKNLLAVLTITIAFTSTTKAQNKYFLTYYNKAQKLYDSGVISKKDFEVLQLNYDQAKQDVINAENDYQIIKEVQQVHRELQILL